ncbi:PREDICTED: CRIB domain-containing protein RIC10 isoform X2 [Nelumbo nucifera]|uniref:CRIB domain-containing protein RIC10 isoform X2 n=2 Tax=Nelumbo nucifera TaxID=4432 RepID=A0A1U7YQ01_NELNU|nr:PREDICTED: CRIB domain-containing protein RIC10 isoform X2 [Nelumbo nucifera]DAD20559.1 TPA_asm: hypothetical protein HUJ06_022022 [Nelumbo nucifera]
MTKMKGIYKGFKYLSQIFDEKWVCFSVGKDRDMEIGYPTDVKHVAHIGWDSHSSNAPSWMNKFKTSSDFSATSLSKISDPRDPNLSAVSTWSSQDFERSMGPQQASQMTNDKKHRKKTKSTSSSSSRSSRK